MPNSVVKGHKMINQTKIENSIDSLFIAVSNIKDSIDDTGTIMFYQIDNEVLICNIKLNKQIKLNLNNTQYAISTIIERDTNNNKKTIKHVLRIINNNKNSMDYEESINLETMKHQK